jgi:hypothetical protein
MQIFLQYKKGKYIVNISQIRWNYMDVYVFNLYFHGLLYFSWMESSVRMIDSHLSLIWYLF